MKLEQERLKYFDDENKSLEGNPIKLPEKKGEDKEAVQEKEFFFRPPKGISTAPDPKPIGILYRYPLTNPNANIQDNIQELLVAVIKAKDGTDNFRQSVLQNLRSSFTLSAAGPMKMRDAGGVPAGHTVHYEFFELQGGPNQPGGCVYFHRENVQGEGAYQVAIAFRATSSQTVIANDSPVMELALASLRVASAAQIQHNRFKPVPPSGTPSRR